MAEIKIYASKLKSEAAKLNTYHTQLVQSKADMKSTFQLIKQYAGTTMLDNLSLKMTNVVFKEFDDLCEYVKNGATIANNCATTMENMDSQLRKMFKDDPAYQVGKPSSQKVVKTVVEEMADNPVFIDVVNKLKKAGYKDPKLAGMKYAAAYMIKAGYEEAFVIGMCANIAHEGDPGRFESSAYIAHPENEPNYLRYVDSKYHYRSDFSGKNISQVGLDRTEQLINSLKNDPNRPRKDVYFGIGSVQWTSTNRVEGLLECYREVCGDNNYPTAQQCAEAEALWICRELQKKGNQYIYNNWRAQYGGQNNAAAARAAANTICREYERPAGLNSAASTRSSTAGRIWG